MSACRSWKTQTSQPRNPIDVSSTQIIFAASTTFYSGRLAQPLRRMIFLSEASAQLVHRTTVQQAQDSRSASRTEWQRFHTVWKTLSPSRPAHTRPPSTYSAAADFAFIPHRFQGNRKFNSRRKWPRLQHNEYFEYRHNSAASIGGTDTVVAVSSTLGVQSSTFNVFTGTGIATSTLPAITSSQGDFVLIQESGNRCNLFIGIRR